MISGSVTCHNQTLCDSLTPTVSNADRENWSYEKQQQIHWARVEGRGRVPAFTPRRAWCGVILEAADQRRPST